MAALKKNAAANATNIVLYSSAEAASAARSPIVASNL
jgi:hypothetical protein